MQAGGRRFDPGTLHSKKRCKSSGSADASDQTHARFWLLWNGPGTLSFNVSRCDALLENPVPAPRPDPGYHAHAGITTLPADLPAWTSVEHHLGMLIESSLQLWRSQGLKTFCSALIGGPLSPLP